MNIKLFEKFKAKAILKFGDKFDYSTVDYINCSTPITIICKEHGEFETTPQKFLISKFGCPKCKQKGIRKTTEQFINECKELYGDRFLYNKVNYVDSSTKVIVTCPIHGDFLTRPSDFLRGHNCPKCKADTTRKFNKNKALTQEEFIKRCTLLYENLFNYSKVIYVNNKTKVLIHSNICNEDFLIIPSDFLRGNFKRKYIGEDTKSQNLTSEIFIQRAKLLHKNYDYSKVKYINLREKVCIVCPKHGEFWLTPVNHLYNFQGCPKCAQSKGEQIVDTCLSSLKLNYTSQYKTIINDLICYIDFYITLNDKIIFIEYNGILHYQPVDIFGGEPLFKKLQFRDEQVRNYCLENNIILLEYSYQIPFEQLKDKIIDDLNEIKNRT